MTNLAAASIKSTGSVTTRTLGARFGDVINVKDFGAVGDGTTDDTAAIQAAFDYAFGTWADPYGGLLDVGSDFYRKKPVFFPIGNYKVSSSISDRAITGTSNNGGLIRLTVSTAGLATGDNINVVGVGGTTEANGSHFITVDDATHCTLKLSTYANAWTSGGTISTPCLRLRAVASGWIYGAGRQTNISSASPNAAAICTGGMSYTRFDNLSFSVPTSGHGIAFQLDCAADETEQVALQSNTFFSCGFSGGDYGLKIGAGQNMGSETMILQCYFLSHDIAGVYTGNQNACDNTIIGGNNAGSGKGIWVLAGSINTIHAVSFQNNVTHDIHVEGAVGDGYSICGCRTESINFVQLDPAMPMHISGCNGTRSESGFFFKGAGSVTIAGCESVNGYIEGGNARVLVGGCNFHRADYLTAGSDNYAALTVLPQMVTTQTGTAYSISGSDASSKVMFNNSSPITVTVLNNVDTTTRLVAGNKIEAQQIGTGRVTFVGSAGVTIRNSNGLKTRVQYSCVTLVCDGPNLWTLSGDTAVA